MSCLQTGIPLEITTTRVTQLLWGHSSATWVSHSGWHSTVPNPTASSTEATPTSPPMEVYPSNPPHIPQLPKKKPQLLLTNSLILPGTQPSRQENGVVNNFWIFPTGATPGLPFPWNWEVTRPGRRCPHGVWQVLQAGLKDFCEFLWDSPALGTGRSWIRWRRQRSKGCNPNWKYPSPAGKAVRILENNIFCSGCNYRPASDTQKFVFIW